MEEGHDFPDTKDLGKLQEDVDGGGVISQQMEGRKMILSSFCFLPPFAVSWLGLTPPGSPR